MIPLSLGDDPTKERNMREGKKKRMNEERQEGPYKGVGGGQGDKPDLYTHCT